LIILLNYIKERSFLKIHHLLPVLAHLRWVSLLLLLLFPALVRWVSLLLLFPALVRWVSLLVLFPALVRWVGHYRFLLGYHLGVLLLLQVLLLQVLLLQELLLLYYPVGLLLRLFPLLLSHLQTSFLRHPHVIFCPFSSPCLLSPLSLLLGPPCRKSCLF